MVGRQDRIPSDGRSKGRQGKDRFLDGRSLGRQGNKRVLHGHTPGREVGEQKMNDGHTAGRQSILLVPSNLKTRTVHVLGHPK